MSHAREIFTRYMKKCASSNIPQDVALAQYFKNTGSVELGERLTKTAKWYKTIGKYLPGETTGAKLLSAAMIVPVANSAIDVGNWALGRGSSTDYKLNQLQNDIDILKKNTSGSSQAHILTGGGIGGTLGAVYGPQIFDKLDPFVARIIGGILGGSAGGLGGHLLHNFTYTK